MHDQPLYWRCTSDRNHAHDWRETKETGIRQADDADWAELRASGVGKPRTVGVRRPEDPVRRGEYQFLLGTGQAGAPQMRERVVVVAVLPQRHEGVLVPDEPARRAVAGPLCYLGKGHADRSDPSQHTRIVEPTRPGARGREGRTRQQQPQPQPQPQSSYRIVVTPLPIRRTPAGTRTSAPPRKARGRARPQASPPPRYAVRSAGPARRRSRLGAGAAGPRPVRRGTRRCPVPPA